MAFLDNTGLARLWSNIKSKFVLKTDFNTHTADTTKHITAAERNTWHTKASKNTIAVTWTSGTSRAVGDLVIYDDKLWKCKTANSSQVPAEGAYWGQVLLADSTVEVVETSNGFYKKYQDGFMELVMEISITFNCSTASGSLYVGTDANVYSFPVTFKAKPRYEFTIRANSTYSCMPYLWKECAVTTNSIANFSVARTTSASSVPTKVIVHAYGKWK